MKRYITICILIFGIIVTGGFIYLNHYVNRNFLVDKVNGDNISTTAVVKGDKVYQVDGNKQLKEIFIKGVNIGLGKPNAFPGEVSITKAEYIQWFEKIKEMGADYVRVYTLQSPAFYDALYEFNMISEPLYLIQEAYMNEDYINQYKDVYNEKINSDFKTEIENIINAIHGNADIKKVVGHAHGNYTSDISKYTIMFLLGIEFDGETIETTNRDNTSQTSFNGDYLYTKNATPFEVFLAKYGDYAIKYETENYQKQTIIGFANWPTSDPLDHPNEPEDMNKMQGFDVEHILHKDSFISGMVASYHVYPYYPDFLNFEDQSKFLTSAPTNPYQDYLKRLKQHHSIPVLIAEYGVPTSRGVTHIDSTRGFNQGGMSEQAQGNAILAMTQDIKDAGMCGSIIFSWQDEWFKRTWNTMELTSASGRSVWHDVQTSETSFGLLAFDSTEKMLKSSSLENNNLTIKVKSDAEYLTISLSKKNLNLNEDHFELFFDTTDSSGFDHLDNRKLKSFMDFYLNINGENNSELFVDPYYDNFNYLFGRQLNINLPIKQNTVLTSAELNPIRLRLRNRIRIPETKKEIEPSYYTTGKLTYGTIDRTSKDYKPDNDFYVTDDTITIRIAWELLNFSNPSQGFILDDFYNHYIEHIDGVEMKTKQINKITLGVTCNGKEIDYIDIPLNYWDRIDYQERLKQSYTIVKDAWNND